jgi:hypothetical protein
MSKLPLLFIAFSTIAVAGEPLWHAPVRPTANAITSQSMELYQIQGEVVTQLSGYIQQDEIHVSEEKEYTLVVGPQTRFVEDEVISRYDGPGRAQRIYCRSTFARTFREGQVLTLQFWTHEKPVMITCPWSKRERSRTNAQLGPIRQRYYRFSSDGNGGMNMSFTPLNTQSESAGFAPRPFRPMVRLER